MTDELAELRADLAAARGLPPAAISFLTGSTAEEVEAQADQLARLIAARVPEQTPEQTNSLMAALAPGVKQARQRALVQALHGRPSPPRDERGRYAAGSKAISFDGGARTPAPLKGPPEQEHDGWLVDVVAHRRADAGARF